MHTLVSADTGSLRRPLYPPCTPPGSFAIPFCVYIRRKYIRSTENTNFPFQKLLRPNPCLSSPRPPYPEQQPLFYIYDATTMTAAARDVADVAVVIIIIIIILRSRSRYVNTRNPDVRTAHKVLTYPRFITLFRNGSYP